MLETEIAPVRNRTSGSRTAAGGSGTTFSIIGADVTITGNIAASVDLHVDGRIDGDVSCASLVQGSGSTITGGVVADSARLGGKIEGSIEAVDLVIEAGAEVHGDVTYTNLTIEPGGRVEGAFQHKSSAGGPNAKTTAEKSAEPANVESIDSARDAGVMRA